MKISKFIEALITIQKERGDIPVFGFDRTDEPYEAIPEYMDWGNPNDGEAGVYVLCQVQTNDSKTT